MSDKTVMSDAIAVVGLSCRLPGAPDPGSYWRLLRDGTDAVRDVPQDRWSADAGPGRGGFLEQVDRFEPGFFGISPKEAAAMDPQQRLALELGWEALEHAGILPEHVRGSGLGVFVGCIWDDYTTLAAHHGIVTRHSLTGLQRGVVANRLSYFLDARGPSLVVDTGQSSSLVAVHLACESLRSGESSAALAGGVNLNLVPGSTRVLGEFGALSPDGRCHTFDARANGFVRGEGGGLVLLKRLRDALADGDRVLSVIRGSAVTNDGGTDTLTTPGRLAQEAVVREAHRRAGVAPRDVGYVELHGTGTKVGDPIEAAALAAVLGSARAASEPLPVGSVKTNIGHLEGAAGIAGLLKAVLAIRHRELPPSLHFETPSPLIPLDTFNLRVVRRLEPWASDGPRVAGVSSFGVGGTNCHVVLGEFEHHPAPDTDQERPEVPGTDQGRPQARAARPVSPAAGEPRPLPWLLSGHTTAGLRGQAERLLGFAGGGEESGAAPGDIALTLLTDRTAFAHRAVVIGRDRAELLGGLRELATDGQAPLLVTGEAAKNAAPGTARTDGVVLVFPGQGSQWTGMAKELLAGSPVFAEQIEKCAAALEPHVDWSLKDVLRDLPGAASLERVDVVQPVLFAVMVSLARLWEAGGVRCGAVIGHSQGEIAAAHVAGLLSLADAAGIVALRSRIIAQYSEAGAMASLPVAVDAVRARLTPGLSVAAVNGPAATVVAGDPDELAALLDEFRAEGVDGKLIPVDYASHSPQVEALRERLLAALAAVAPRGSGTAFYSTVTGGLLDGAELTAAYWYRNLRSPVEFERAARAALADGHRVFVECSPHPVLGHGLRQICDPDAVVAPTLRRGKGGLGHFLTSLATLHVHGVPVDWRPFVPAGARRTVLPGYAFQREPYWLDTSAGTGARPGSAASAAAHEEEQAAPVRTRDELLAIVRKSAALVLGHSSGDQVDASLTFKSLGFDSAGAVEFGERLSRATGLPVSPTITFRYPTPAEVADSLGAELTAGQTELTAVSASAKDDEPVAIVAMTGRWPGDADSPEDLWNLVAGAEDAVTPFPADRGWDLDALYDPGRTRPGTSYTRHGGFLRGAGDFDADFFGLSPREAAAMDPQQRLLLESCWELCERAGIDPTTLRRSPTGVFIGAMAQEYGPRLHETAEAHGGHALTGSLASVLSGRIAYTLGLEGPALTVDTACSSSLVALHLAVRSLRSGESDLAIAGGVTVMSSPGIFTEFSRQGGLSEDGRCKAFGAGADGTGWAEAVGVLLLERLSDARRNGHRVLAVVRGTAVNQDGASNGLTAPSGTAQERVVRQALADARLAPGDVDVVEAHGTGTKLGDPIEAQALLAAYGQGRSGEQPLWLGSLKSNIGHTQAAAGVSGVIKMVQAMRHGILPKTLHADEPSPHVDWSGSAVQLLTEAREWPGTDNPRRAGVSSFGVSGTNAHVVLEQAPAEEPAEPVADRADEGPWLWPLSAKSEQALRAQVERLRAYAVDGPGLGAVSRSLATTRAHFEHRAVVAGGTRGEFLDGLRALAGGDVSATAYSARAGEHAVAFLFSGQGGQYPGMGRELADRFPVFAEAFGRAAAEVDRHLGAEHPVWQVTFDEPGTEGLLDQTLYTQPALFALQVGLFRLYEHWGVRPAVLAGHSIGEVAAAHVAGVLSLEDAATLIAARARLMQALPEGGAMVAVQACEEEVVGQLTDGVGLAAVNAADSVVVAGDEDAVEEVAGHFRDFGRKTKRLTVSHAFHSPLMEPVLDDFDAVARTLTYHEPRIPAVSTVTGEPVSTEWTDPGYWTGHIRASVRFHHALTHLGATHPKGLTLVELGPGAVLTALARQTLPEHTAVPSLKPEHPQAVTVLTAAGTLHAHGAALDWRALTPDTPAVPLPTYPFQHQRYWLNASEGLAPRPDAREEALFEVEWKAAPGKQAAGDRDVVVLSLADLVPPGDLDDRAAAAHRGLERTLASLLDRLGGTQSRLVVTAVGAVAAGKGEPVDPATASVWALLHSVQNEFPDRLVLVDHDGEEQAAVAAALATGEAQCAVRGGRVLVPRLTAVRKAPREAARWDPEGTVLVTGATGALAGLVARHLVTEHGVTRLLLTSRRGLDAPGAPGLLAELSALGAQVTVTAGDIADREFIGELLDSLPPEHPLTGVVHTAGVRDDGLVTALTPDRVSAVLRPKADAAWHLHALTEERGIRLGHFVLFSSIAAAFGGPGQGNYAAANGFLDALAVHRRASGLPATSVAWGLWEHGEGMAGQLSGADVERVVRQGYTPIPAAQGLALFDAALAQPGPAFVATPVDREVLRTSGIAPALLRTLVREDTPAAAPVQEAVEPLAERVAAVSGSRRTKLVLSVVREETARVLGRPDPSGIPASRPFKEMGFDSLTAVDLRNRLSRVAGHALSPTVVFDHPTPGELARYLISELAPAELSGAELLAAEFARLEAALDGLGDGQDSRRAIHAGLLRLLGRWEDPDPDGDGPAGPDGLDLDTASDEDLFKLVAANRRD